MKTKILVLTHGQVGHSMLKAAKNTLGNIPNGVYALAVDDKPDIESITNFITTLLNDNNIINLLILTDLFGSTPCNIASQFANRAENVAAVSGLNFGMLIKSINYIDLPIDELVSKAVIGGKECIKTCGSK